MNNVKTLLIRMILCALFFNTFFLTSNLCAQDTIPINPDTCESLTTFEDGGTYSRDVCVPSFERPDYTFDEIPGCVLIDNNINDFLWSRTVPPVLPKLTTPENRDEKRLHAGDIIHLGPGKHDKKRISVQYVRGTAEHPIQMVGPDPQYGEAIFTGSETFLCKSDYLVLRNLTFDTAKGNGINIDNHTQNHPLAGPLLIDNLTFRNNGNFGNQDNIKLSGINDFIIMNTRIYNSEKSASGIDLVGCHNGLIINNTIENVDDVFIQIKGGSSNITVHGNMLRSAVGSDARGIKAGSASGAAFYRPPVTATDNYTARNLRITSNVIIDTNDGAITFGGCVDCLVANNVFYEMKGEIFRILGENTPVNGFDMQPNKNNKFVNNIVIFKESQIDTFSQVAPAGSTLNEAETTTISNNLWFAKDNPSFNYSGSKAALPVAESNPILQQDPLFARAELISQDLAYGDILAEDFMLRENSPASNNALTTIDGPVSLAKSDFAGTCNINNRGPYEDGCIEDWVCSWSDWTACLNGNQSRTQTCTDLSSCSAPDTTTTENRACLEAGDINGDSAVNTTDVILALQIASGQTPADIELGSDMDEDGCIGVSEAIIILQRSAE